MSNLERIAHAIDTATHGLRGLRITTEEGRELREKADALTATIFSSSSGTVPEYSPMPPKSPTPDDPWTSFERKIFEGLRKRAGEVSQVYDGGTVRTGGRPVEFGSKEWLYALHVRTAGAALDLLKKKNADYAGDRGIFHNLNACEALGVQAEIGMLIRMQDKLSRLTTVIGSGKNHVGDSIEGEVLDIINYAVLLLARVQVRDASKEAPHARPLPQE